MNGFDHYISLLLSFPHLMQSEEYPVTIEQLSGILCCTSRNVKLVLRKWEQNGWIIWKAGRGRGNISTLCCQLSLEEASKLYIAELLSKGAIHKAFEFVQHPSLPEYDKNMLRAELEGQFGLRREKIENRTADVLKIPSRRRLSTINPRYSNVSAESHLARQLFDTLINYNEVTNSFDPHLAHDWKEDLDGLRWTFYLRKSVRFHHGRMLQAKDIVSTFDSLRLDNLPRCWMFHNIESIIDVDDYTVCFKLRKPDRFFLHYVSSLDASIFPYDVMQSETKLIGTGPFKMGTYSEEKLVFHVNEDYFKERAHLDLVEMWFVPEGAKWPIQFQISPSNKELDLDTTQPIMSYEVGCRYLAFNFRKESAIHDEKLRQAIRLAADRKQWIEQLGGSRLRPADSFMPEKSEEMSFHYTSLEEARSLVDQSSYRGEVLHFYFYDLRESIEDTNWLRDRFETIGLSISLHPFPVSEMDYSYVIKNADLLLMGEIIGSDVELERLMMFRDERSFLYHMLGDKHLAFINRIIDQLLSCPDEEERNAHFDLIENYLKQENLMLFNYHVAKKSNYHPTLHGISINSYGWADFRKLWIQKA